MSLLSIFLVDDERRKANADAARCVETEMVLAELRKHTGMTQQQRADALGISQSSLSEQDHQDNYPRDVNPAKSPAILLGLPTSSTLDHQDATYGQNCPHDRLAHDFLYFC